MSDAKTPGYDYTNMQTAEWAMWHRQWTGEDPWTPEVKAAHDAMVADHVVLCHVEYVEDHGAPDGWVRRAPVRTWWVVPPIQIAA